MNRNLSFFITLLCFSTACTENSKSSESIALDDAKIDLGDDAVAEEKNMTKAAAKLFVTQPALSISINRLEKQLGFKIFDPIVTRARK